jgi:hypothetical protein
MTNEVLKTGRVWHYTDEKTGDVKEMKETCTLLLSQAMHDVIEARINQIFKHGYTPQHDAKLKDGELARAGACYALKGADAEIQFGQWPWADDVWEPKDRRTNLVNAAALIVAEIEKMDHKAA